MAAEDHKAQVERYLSAIDSGSEAVIMPLIDELFADSYRAHMAGGTLEGRDGLKAHVRRALAAFGDMRHIVEDNFAAGDRVATRVTFRAVQKGEFLGVASAGQRIECPIIYIHRFAAGRIEEAWLDWDALFTVEHGLGAGK